MVPAVLHGKHCPRGRETRSAPLFVWPGRPRRCAGPLCRRVVPGHIFRVTFPVCTPTPTPSWPLSGVLPHLDGLRGVAVVLVMLYHARVGLSGGYVGVDVFLVLSGFLVTSLLMTEHDAGGVSLLGFWSRRVRRLLPVSALVVTASALAGVLLLEPQRLSRLAGDVFGVATFSANVRFLGTHGDYLGGLSLPSPLLHFWSLALEEQFYLLWPMLLVVSLRFARRASKPEHVLIAVCALLAAVSLAASVALTSTYSAFSYYLLPTRAWELLAGALLALCWPTFTKLPWTRAMSGVSSTASTARSILGVLGMVALLFSSVVFDASTVFPGWAAILPVLGTLAVLVAGAASVSGVILSFKALRWLGVRSYGAYLWHWPILVFGGVLGWTDSPWARITAVVLAVGAADVSFRFLEAPVRRSLWLAVSVRRTAFLGVGVSTALLVVALFVQSSPNLTSADSPGVARSAASSQQSTPLPAEDTASRQSSRDALDARAAPSAAGSRVLLLGDSTLAPLRWFVEGSRGLDRWGASVEFVLDAESCRRLSMGSCRGYREGRTPDAAADVLTALTARGESFRFVVLMAGYHSTPEDFEKEFDAFRAAAMTHGVEKIYVLEYRESLAFPLDGSRGKSSVFEKFNEVIREQEVTPVSKGEPEIVVLGWNLFSAAAPDWFRLDGIHVNLAGAIGLGEFIAREVLSELGLSCGSFVVCPPVPSASSAANLLAAYDLVATDEHCYEIGVARTQKCRRDKLR